MSNRWSTAVGVAGVAALVAAFVWAGVIYPRTLPEVSASGLAVEESPTLADALPAGGALRVLVAGDSISRGFYASTRDAAYVARLEDSLNDRWDPDVAVVGQPGQQSFQVTPQIPGRPVDLVVVELGTNDATRDPVHIGEHYAALLRRVRKTSPDAALVCLGSWQYAYRSGLVDPTIANTCEANGGAFVPLSDLYARNAFRGPEGAKGVHGEADNFHPNDDGHKAIAARVVAALD